MLSRLADTAATGLLAVQGAAAGWRCRLVEGLEFTCTRRNGVVTSFGE
jgi:hypothetical protein